jgi:hypothetical protein
MFEPQHLISRKKKIKFCEYIDESSDIASLLFSHINECFDVNKDEPANLVKSECTCIAIKAYEFSFCFMGVGNIGLWSCVV